MDVFVVFDNVFVPEDRIFVKGNVEAANVWRQTAQPSFAMHQTLTKDIAKSEFVFGVALLLAESTGINEHFHVQSKLGEIGEIVQLLRNSVESMERHAEEYKNTGYLIPDYTAGSSAVSHFADLYQRAMEILMDLGGSGLVGVPAYEDLEADDPLGGDVKTYFRGKEMNARERIGVQKLARDLTISGFGRREELYERFHVGGPMRVKSNLYKGFPDKDGLKERAREHGLRTIDKLESD
ncbi:4-hydroxyphenylacetate 3-hydroxylase C-terminal domain-containing protein [Halobellus rufus]|uniref:4-hydroxyphenylacetate 3-hydroxylase C-terminal domain-containing protein n=1 Tax=Halobellus rufus TaxID=1448860 RepID=UPI000679779A|nr:4-hydroxyphenylacetate 3-hydroxylase C-terminal domain-containing protein [Halobellus rufus]